MATKKKKTKVRRHKISGGRRRRSPAKNVYRKRVARRRNASLGKKQKKIKRNCAPCFVKVGKRRVAALAKHARKTRRKTPRPKIKRTTAYYKKVGQRRVKAWRKYAKANS